MMNIQKYIKYPFIINGKVVPVNEMKQYIESVESYFKTEDGRKYQLYAFKVLAEFIDYLVKVKKELRNQAKVHADYIKKKANEYYPANDFVRIDHVYERLKEYGLITSTFTKGKDGKEHEWFTITDLGWQRWRANRKEIEELVPQTPSKFFFKTEEGKRFVRFVFQTMASFIEHLANKEGKPREEIRVYSDYIKDHITKTYKHERVFIDRFGNRHIILVDEVFMVLQKYGLVELEEQVTRSRRGGSRTHHFWYRLTPKGWEVYDKKFKTSTIQAGDSHAL